MTLPKFIITMDGYFRLGMVNQQCSRWDRYLGMTAAMTQVPVPTATLYK